MDGFVPAQIFFFSSRRRHTRFKCDWSSDVCSSDLDTHGHLAGDAALVRIAEVFRKTTRQVDCVARYGGEEFVVMLLECTMATAAIVGERVRARVAEQDLGPGSLTVSIGLAEYPEGGETPEELIASADAAMYQAKSSRPHQGVGARGSQQRQEDPKPARPQRTA